jgi:hypothetical protein
MLRKLPISSQRKKSAKLVITYLCTTSTPKFSLRNLVLTLWFAETQMSRIEKKAPSIFSKQSKSFNDTRVARWFLFKPKIPVWVYFGGPLQQLGIFNGHLVIL